MSGGGAAIDARAGCERCGSPLERGDLRCAVCALPAPLPPLAVAPAAADRARVLRCRECNAAVGFVPDVAAPRCAFCGAVMEIEQPVDPLEEARVRVPFAVGHDEATRALRGWLATRGFFAPRTLHEEATVDALAPLYWAAWITSARVAVSWTADSDEGARRSRWAPHAGTFHLDCDQLLIPASRGLEEHECAELGAHYDLSRAVLIDADGDGMADVPVESFDAQRSSARAQVHAAIEELAAARAEPHVPGTRTRKVHVACLVERQTTERAALPAWVLAYRFRDRVYRAVVHGQRANVVIGRAPVNRTRVALVVLAALAAVAALVALAVVLRGR